MFEIVLLIFLFLLMIHTLVKEIKKEVKKKNILVIVLSVLTLIAIFLFFIVKL